ncbi:MAG: hypothetical protein LC732_03360 [Acidobacteria bacterium]|nr:hypothetical protein [Acidobacteriota bacterium]
MKLIDTDPGVDMPRRSSGLLKLSVTVMSINGFRSAGIVIELTLIFSPGRTNAMVSSLR